MCKIRRSRANYLCEPRPSFNKIILIMHLASQLKARSHTDDAWGTHGRRIENLQFWPVRCPSLGVRHHSLLVRRACWTNAIRPLTKKKKISKGGGRVGKKYTYNTHITTTQGGFNPPPPPLRTRLPYPHIVVTAYQSDRNPWVCDWLEGFWSNWIIQTFWWQCTGLMYFH